MNAKYAIAKPTIKSRFSSLGPWHAVIHPSAHRDNIAE
jgi:hypothetical protein